MFVHTHTHTRAENQNGFTQIFITRWHLGRRDATPRHPGRNEAHVDLDGSGESASSKWQTVLCHIRKARDYVHQECESNALGLTECIRSIKLERCAPTRLRGAGPAFVLANTRIVPAPPLVHRCDGILSEDKHYVMECSVYRWS